MTVHVPLTALGELRPFGFDWLVPAFRLELVTALMRSLPKELRKPLVPVPDVAAAVLARMKPRSEPLPDALSRELAALRGVRIPRTAWDVRRLPAHLRMTFAIEDGRGRVIAEGDDLAALRQEVAPRLRAELTAAHPELERRGLTSWDIGRLPREIELRGSGVRAYPALVDEGATAGVRVLETPEAQAEAMALGTRRLLLLTVPSPLRHVLDRLPKNAQLALAGAPHGGVRAVLEDAGPPRSTRSSPRPAARRGTRPASGGCATTSRASCRTARPRSSGRSQGSSTPRGTSAAGSSRSPRRRSRRRAATSRPRSTG